MIPLRRVALSIGLIAGGVLGLLILRLFAPGQFSFYPQCMFHRVTGFNCPGCGGTRCLHALLNGRILEALNDNALIIVFLPYLAIGTVRRWWPWVRGLPQPVGRPMKSWLVYTIVIAVIGFAVLRNLPWVPFSYLSPR